MFHRPRSTEEALTLLALEGATILAGGTDIFPALVDRPPPKRLVDISGLKELRGISRVGQTVRIGAATTWTDIARADLPPCFDMLRQAALEIGAVQVQNRGTIGGNLCNASPAADSAPPLLVLDAEVELASPRGLRLLPLEDFLIGNRRTARAADEIMTAILAPAESDASRSVFLKLGARKHLVISIVMVAAMLCVNSDGTIEKARIAVGSASAVAQRLSGLERRLAGLLADDAILDRVLPADFSTLSPIGDARATANYRIEAAYELVQRALAQLTQPNNG